MFLTLTLAQAVSSKYSQHPVAKRPIRRANPDGINVTRIEYENLEAAVRKNTRELERIHRRIDELLERIERLSKRSA